jgi:adenylate cyclase
VVAVAATTAFWALNPGGLVEIAREASFAAMGEAFPRRETSGAVAVIDINRESLAKIGPWPWRRSLIADLVAGAASADPRAIGIDILLAGEDRKGPAALARELAAMTGRPGLAAAEFDDDDKLLAGAVAKAGNVVLGLVLDDSGADPTPIPVPLAVEGSAGGISPRAATGLLAPYEPFAAAAAGIGVLSFDSGPLGRVRSAPLIALARGEVFPGFALEAVRVAGGASALILKGETRLLAAGATEVPTDGRGEMRLHFSPRAAWSGRTISAAAMLSDLPSARPHLTDKIVLIGSSAPEAGAFLPVAGGELAPTVQVQAEAIDQMLSGRFLVRPPAVWWWELAAMAALGLLATLFAVRLSPATATLAWLVLAAAWLAASAAAFIRAGLLVDPIGPAATALIAANVTGLAAFVRTRTLKNAIQQKFERYVPPAVVARLLREPQRLKLDGELREVTALVTDVEGFSRMTEASDPQQLVRVLDAYFDCVTDLIVRHGGMVDKIVGDGALAFFNIPAPLPDHPDCAVRCAQAILAATEEFRRAGEAAALGFGRTRFGIETGTAIVGDVGGDRRLDYTAYGVVVNRAARLEGANKVLGSSICIGPAAAPALTRDIPLRPLGVLAIDGADGAWEVFEPWAADVPADLRARYTEGVSLATTDRPRARDMFAELAAELPGDRVIAAWRVRLSG